MQHIQTHANFMVNRNCSAEAPECVEWTQCPFAIQGQTRSSGVLCCLSSRVRVASVCHDLSPSNSVPQLPWQKVLQKLTRKDLWKLLCFLSTWATWQMFIIMPFIPHCLRQGDIFFQHLQHPDSYMHGCWSEAGITTRHIPLLYLLEVRRADSSNLSKGERKQFSLCWQQAETVGTVSGSVCCLIPF